MMTENEMDQKSAIVFAGVKRLGAVEGFPVTDFALVAETDLDLGEVRDCLGNRLAGRHLDLGPGRLDGSVEVMGIPGGAEDLPDVGGSGDG